MHARAPAATRSSLRRSSRRSARAFGAIRPSERRPVDPRENVVDEDIEQAEHCRVMAGDGCVVERELSSDTQLDIVVHESYSGRDQYLRKGLARRAANQLVVVEFRVEIHVAQGPRLAEVAHAV